MEATATVKFTAEERSAILTTAAEGGINYWFDAGSVVRGRDSWVTSLTASDEWGDGGTLTDQDDRLDRAASQVLTDRPGIDTAAQLRNSIALQDLDLDAEAADVLVQIALLGDIVYG